MNNPESNLENLINTISIRLSDTIRQAISCIDKGARGIALIVDEDMKLLGTITDGDIRRAMLGNVDLNTPVNTLLQVKPNSLYPVPVTAKVGTHPSLLLKIMQEHSILQIPIINDSGQVVGLTTMNELLPKDELPIQAVIMAGGFGNRLRPLTDDTPKPMLPVGGKPLMERIVDQLRDAGVGQVNVTMHYMPEKITSYFGDGKAFGVKMNYVREDSPLGTGGALGLMDPPTQPLLVINGDILTQVDFRAMLNFHQEQHAEMTVAVRRFDIQVPFGVIESDGPFIRTLREKPNMSFFVNAGIYLLQPSVYKFIPSGNRFNMTDLIQWLLDAKLPVASFLVREYWLDVGQHEQYERAQTDVQDWRIEN